MRGGMRRRAGCLLAAALAAGLTPVVGAPPAAALPPAPLGGAEWWFDAWRVYDIWQQSKGAGMTVAVVESGVQASVPELAGVVLPGVDFDHGGDGRQDLGGEGHGTAMAALIAANGRATGMTGIAPEAKILPVTIAHQASGYSPERMAAGIRFAVDHGANIVNLSIGGADPADPGNCEPEVQDAVRYAVDHNAVVVAAAGNDGDGDNFPNSPAACRGVVAVGAIDRNARPWVSSQRQPYVDVAAPGVDTRAINQFGHLVEGNGTSDATALTSGAIALVWSKYRNLSNRQIVARMLYTLRDRPPGGRKDPQRGYGTLLPQAAITADVPADAPNPIFDELRAAPPSDPNAVPAVTPPPPVGSAARHHHRFNSRGLVMDLVGAAVFFLAFVVGARRRRRRYSYPPEPWQPTPGPGPYGPPGSGPYTSAPGSGPYAGPPPPGPQVGAPPFPGTPAPPGPPPYGYAAGAPYAPYGGPSAPTGPVGPPGEPPEPAPPPAG